MRRLPPRPGLPPGQTSVPEPAAEPAGVPAPSVSFVCSAAAGGASARQRACASTELLGVGRSWRPAAVHLVRTVLATSLVPVESRIPVPVPREVPIVLWKDLSRLWRRIYVCHYLVGESLRIVAGGSRIVLFQWENLFRILAGRSKIVIIL
jgi:hypothetical protein